MTLALGLLVVITTKHVSHAAHHCACKSTRVICVCLLVAMEVLGRRLAVG